VYAAPRRRDRTAGGRRGAAVSKTGDLGGGPSQLKSNPLGGLKVMRFRAIFPVCAAMVLASCSREEAAALPVPATHPSQPSRKSSTEARVRSLVELLVSPVPPPCPDDVENGCRPKDRSGRGAYRTGEDFYEDPQVNRARRELISLGTTAYPELVHHLHDKRYSFSRIVAEWNDYTVGDVVREVLAEDVEYLPVSYVPLTGQKSPDFSFEDYLNEQDLPAWAELAASTTKQSLRILYIEWFIEKETKRADLSGAAQQQFARPFHAEIERIRASTRPPN
jgi:hypothetical protein